jgi:preprotein translocase subunit SecD
MKKRLFPALVVLALLLLTLACTRTPWSRSEECDCTRYSPATMEFFAAQSEPREGYAAKPYGGGEIYLAVRPGVTLRDAGQAVFAEDEYGSPVPYLSLSEEGARRMRELSRAQLGKKIAIVHNGFIISAPEVLTEIDSCVIPSSNFTRQQVCDIVCTVEDRKNREDLEDR